MLLAQASADLAVDTSALQTDAAASVGGFIAWAVAVCLGLIALRAMVRYLTSGVNPKHSDGSHHTYQAYRDKGLEPREAYRMSHQAKRMGIG